MQWVKSFMHRSLYPRKRSPVAKWDPEQVCTPWRRQNILLLQGIERRFFGCPARKLVTISTTLILQLPSLNLVTTKPYINFNALELNTCYRLLVNWTAEIVKRQCPSVAWYIGSRTKSLYFKPPMNHTALTVMVEMPLKYWNYQSHWEPRCNFVFMVELCLLRGK